MTKIEPIGIGGLHRDLSIPEIYIENTKLHDEVNGLRKQRRKARGKQKQLQSNWNSLRDELKQAYRELFELELINGRELINNILDKMNELEGKYK